MHLNQTLWLMAPRNRTSHVPTHPPQPPPPIVLPHAATSSPSYLYDLRPKPTFPPSLSTDDISRLRRAYPNPVRVPSTLVEEVAQSWSFSLVGKFLGHTLLAGKFTTFLSSKWSPEQEWEIIPMNYEYFLFRFTSAQYRDLILDGGPWIVDDATLALEPWTPTFISSPHRLPRTVLWMLLPDLPSVW